MKTNKGMALLEMMVALIILMGLTFLYVKYVWKNPAANKITGETERSKGVIQSSQEKVDKLNKKLSTSERQYESSDQ